MHQFLRFLSKGGQRQVALVAGCKDQLELLTVRGMLLDPDCKNGKRFAVNYLRSGSQHRRGVLILEF